MENGSSMTAKDERNKQELAKALINLLNKNATVFEPSFECGLGFIYKETDYHRFEEQVRFLEYLEQIGIVKGEPSSCVLKCNLCNSHNFCIRPICTFCNSSNIIRGIA